MTTASAPLPISYAEFLKKIKPEWLDSSGVFLGPQYGVNYQAEGMTPEQFYEYQNQLVPDPNAVDGKDAGMHRRGATDASWIPGAVSTGSAFQGGSSFWGPLAMFVAVAAGGGAFSGAGAAGAAEVGAGAGEFAGMGSSTGWSAAMDSQAANLGFGSAQAAIDAGAMAPAGGLTATAGSVGASMVSNGVGPGDPGWGMDLGTDAVAGSPTAVGPGDPGWGADLGTEAATGAPTAPGPGDPGWGSDLGTQPVSSGSATTGAKSLADQAKDLITRRYMDAAGNINWGNVLKDGSTAIAAVTAFQQASQGNSGTGGGGYQGGIPNMTALRAAVPTPAGARPGAGGLRYLTDVQYNGNGAAGAAAQQAAVNAQQSGLAAQNNANVAAQQAASGGPYVMGAINGPVSAPSAPAGGSSSGSSTAPNSNSGSGTPSSGPTGGNSMPTSTTQGSGDGMWVQGRFITKAELQNAFKSGVNPVEYLQKQGITDLGQIHELVVKAEGIAGNAPSGDAALQNYFQQYQQYNPNGKYANDFAGWIKDQQPANLNAMRAGVFTGAVTSQADWAPGGIYGPGSAYYGQPGYGSGQGPRGMGDLGGGWGATGAATGGNGQLTPAQQTQVMEAAAAGRPIPTFGSAPAPVSAADIARFYEQHRNDPAAIQKAMQQYGVTAQQAASATGQNASVFMPPTASAPQTGAPGPGISNSEIASFYQQHQNDPEAIQAAMKQYGVSAQQAAAATGQNASVFAPPMVQAQPVAETPRAGISNTEISNFWQQHQNDPAAIKQAMQQYNVTPEQAAAATGQNVSSFQFAGGGLAGLPMAARYLRGPTDGMADMIPARIDGQQEAALGHGEFVVPADVVSHLGNGNSDAGAEALHSMMDKIRVARTGNKKQGREIDPEQFTPGGLAQAYKRGGAVQHFDAGGAPSGVTGTSSNLSEWIGPYVTDMLGKGKALTEMPYQAYQGPLTAGPTALQNQAFTGAVNLQTPGVIGEAANSALQAGQAAGAANYAPTTFTAGDFTAPGTAAQFMSPYMDSVVQNQQRDAQRQADIATTYRQAEQTKAGGFGGSRAAIMDAEAARNLALQKGDIAATGLQSAFTAGQNQFNTQQQANLGYGQATEASKQFGANLGLQGLNTQLNAASTAGGLGVQQGNLGISNVQTQLGAGGVQQGIEQAGMTADQAAFDKEQKNPFAMLTYQQGLLQGLPLSTQNYNVATNPLAAAANTASGIASLWNSFTG